MRISALSTQSCGPAPPKPGHFGDVVQSVEHLLCKQDVAGSSPVFSTNLSRVSAEVARLAHNQKVAGSNPAPATNFSQLSSVAEQRFCKPSVLDSTSRVGSNLILFEKMRRWVLSHMAGREYGGTTKAHSALQRLEYHRTKT